MQVRDVVHAIPGFSQPVSSLSHLVAAAAVLAASRSLLRLARGRRYRVFAVAVYVGCVFVALAISGLYHALDRRGAARIVLQRMDYFAIWLLIAGTFTAVHGIMFQGMWRRGVLTFIWTYVGLGVLLQALWFHIFSGLPGLILYLGLGWVGAFSIVKLGRQIGFRNVRPAWLAGIAYSAGAIVEAAGPPALIQGWVGPHELFHVAVMAGVALHWAFIRRLMVTHAPAPAGPDGSFS